MYQKIQRARFQLNGISRNFLGSPKAVHLDRKPSQVRKRAKLWAKDVGQCEMLLRVGVGFSSDVIELNFPRGGVRGGYFPPGAPQAKNFLKWG